jgi:hypothetical protein
LRAALKPRQLADRDVDRGFGFRDHAERFGVEGDVGEPQRGDLGYNRGVLSPKQEERPDKGHIKNFQKRLNSEIARRQADD